MQTEGCDLWWPCKDHPADKALVSLAVTVPALAQDQAITFEATELAPGLYVLQIMDGAGQRTSKPLIRL